MYSCKVCSRTFTEKRNLTRHAHIHQKEKRFGCGICSKTFNRKEHATRHEKNCKGEKQLPTTSSGSGVKRKMTTLTKASDFKIVVANTAFSKAVVTYELSYPDNEGMEFISLVKNSTSAMKSYIENYRDEHTSLKFNMSIHVNFVKAVDASIVTDPPVVLVTEQMEVYDDTDIDELLSICSQQLINRIEAYEQTGSGWVIHQLVSLDTTVWQLDPLRASSYHPLPQWVQRTKGVRNVHNNDTKCFDWSVCAGIYTPPHSVNRVSWYKEYAERDDAPDFSMLKHPVAIKDIKKFEK